MAINLAINGNEKFGIIGILLNIFTYSNNKHVYTHILYTIICTSNIIHITYVLHLKMYKNKCQKKNCSALHDERDIYFDIFVSKIK